MPKSVSKIIKLHTFPYEILFTTEQDLDKLGKYLMEILPSVSHDEIPLVLDNYASGISMVFSCNATIIKINDITHNVIAHEVFHAIMHLFDSIGMGWSKKSDEAYAYTVAYVTEQIYNIPELKRLIKND